MSQRKPISTHNAPAAIGPYSQAIQAGPWVFCSGQIALDPKTQELVEGGIEAQTRCALENLRAVLGAAHVPLSAVVRTTIFMTDLANFGVVNEIYAEYFDGVPPARATVGVSQLPKGALVEIDAIAVSDASC